MKKSKNWHLLSSEDYNKVFNTLSQKYPKLFMKNKVFIFKKGVHRDIFNDGGLECSKTIIRKFLKLYTAKNKYRELHIENTPRYDLEGKEVDFVTKEDVESLAKKQKEIKNQLGLKKSKKAGQMKSEEMNKENKPNNQDNKLESVNTNANKAKLGVKI